MLHGDAGALVNLIQSTDELPNCVDAILDYFNDGGTVIVPTFTYSATKGEIDPLRGVSSNVCVGKLNKVGTGMVDLFIDMKKTEKYYDELYKGNKEVIEEEQDENEYIDDVEFY